MKTFLRKKWALLFMLFLLLFFFGAAEASLIIIGTADYQGSTYNLIYDDQRNLIWLDYSIAGVSDEIPRSGLQNWYWCMDWAANLENELTFSLDGYVINWTDGAWRLPTRTEYLIADYSALFENIDQSWAGSVYWPMDEYDSTSAYNYQMMGGYSVANSKYSDLNAMAVRSGTVSPVPLPTAVWLLGSGLAGLVALRRRKKAVLRVPVSCR